MIAFVLEDGVVFRACQVWQAARPRTQIAWRDGHQSGFAATSTTRGKQLMVVSAQTAEREISLPCGLQLAPRTTRFLAPLHCSSRLGTAASSRGTEVTVAIPP